MSTALWAAYQLDDDTTIVDENDNYLILEYLEALDCLCETLQVPPLSSLLDSTDMVMDVLDDHDLELMEIMGEFQEQESSWVHPHEAIFILDTLHHALSISPELLEVAQQQAQELLKEIQNCLNTAQTALEQSERFSLTLVS